MFKPISYYARVILEHLNFCTSDNSAPYECMFSYNMRFVYKIAKSNKQNRLSPTELGSRILRTMDDGDI